MISSNVFKIERISEQIVKSFDHLPSDKYLEGSFNYRKRRFHSGNIINSNVQWDSKPKVFNQARNINKLAGGVERTFPAINKATRKYIAEQIVVDQLYPKLPDNSYRLGVHQIRILANDDNMGKPAPEGVHQDGFDYLCVFCVNLYNASGGDSLLLDIKDQSKLIVDMALQPGEMLLFDDRLFMHYASPVIPKLPGDAHRDVFVLTFKKTH